MGLKFEKMATRVALKSYNAVFGRWRFFILDYWKLIFNLFFYKPPKPSQLVKLEVKYYDDFNQAWLETLDQICKTIKYTYQFYLLEQGYYGNVEC